MTVLTHPAASLICSLSVFLFFVMRPDRNSLQRLLCVTLHALDGSKEEMFPPSIHSFYFSVKYTNEEESG